MTISIESWPDICKDDVRHAIGKATAAVARRHQENESANYMAAHPDREYKRPPVVSGSMQPRDDVGRRIGWRGI